MTPEDIEMEELGQVLAASCLPPRDNEAGPICLLFPIHLRGALLLAGNNMEDAWKEDEGKIKTTEEVAGAKVEAVEDNEDAAGEVDPEVVRKAGGAVVAEDKGEPAEKKDKKTLREDPN